jgi:C1A family cysteine protease
MKLNIYKAKKVLTCKKDPADHRDYIFSASPLQAGISESSLSLPRNVSYRSEMTGVRDQGNLGSCVGFATTAMKEWQETVEQAKEVAAGKKDIRKGKEYNLSEAWIYWNCKKIDPWPNEEGTSIRYAMKVLQRIGVPCENAWPYSDVDYGKPESWASLVARWSIIGSYWRVNDLQELKTALTTGPVVIGIPCFLEIFFADSSGYIPYPMNPDVIYGGHAICIVGYDDVKQQVMFKNSWGPDWGNNGYGFLPYRYINDFLWDAWACKDISVTKEMLKGERSL